MMKKVTLPNGIPVVIDRMPSTKVLTALIMFNVGSRNERKNINGISHFLEHLFFKGTEKRPTTLLLSKELDGVGADFNAFTSKDYTGYYVKMDSSHTKLAIDILEDLLFHPLFDPVEVDRERGVIIEEINMYEDNPMRMSEEISEELMFGVDHPLGYRIAGPIENIQNISRNQILKYRDTYYHPDNMVIVLSGNVTPQALGLVKEYFGKAEKKTHKQPAHKKFVFKQKEPRFQLVKKKTAQAHLALSFPGPSHDAPDAAAYSLLSTILGGSMSSRLFINVREREGLCYYIGSSISKYDDMGAFTIQAGFDTSRIHDAVGAIIREITDLRNNGVTEEELAQAKEYIRGKLSLRLEDSEDVASWWAQQFFHRDKMLSPEQYLKKIDAVKLKDVNRIAAETFVRNNANLVIIGPYTATQEKAFQKHLNF